MEQGTTSFEYKKALAFQMIKRFGITGARQTCIQNKWKDVLELINEIKSLYNLNKTLTKL